MLAPLLALFITTGVEEILTYPQEGTVFYLMQDQTVWESKQSEKLSLYQKVTYLKDKLEDRQLDCQAEGLAFVGQMIAVPLTLEQIATYDHPFTWLELLGSELAASIKLPSELIMIQTTSGMLYSLHELNSEWHEGDTLYRILTEDDESIWPAIDENVWLIHPTTKEICTASRVEYAIDWVQEMSETTVQLMEEEGEWNLFRSNTIPLPQFAKGTFVYFNCYEKDVGISFFTAMLLKRAPLDNETVQFGYIISPADGQIALIYKIKEK